MVDVELERRLAELRHGDHLCLIYEDRAEQMAAAVPFIRDGIAAGERCAYVAADQTLEEVAAALSAAGVDVQAAKQRGALLLLTWRTRTFATRSSTPTPSSPSWAAPSKRPWPMASPASASPGR